MSHWGDNQQGPDFGASTAPLGHLDEWDELAVVYLDGAADSTQTQAIEAHLVGCPTCAARVVYQREAASVLRSLPWQARPKGWKTASWVSSCFPLG